MFQDSQDYLVNHENPVNHVKLRSQSIDDLESRGANRR
jgi:hypothetical protein